MMHLDAAPSLVCPLNAVPVVGDACQSVAGAVGGAVSKTAGSVVGASVGVAFDTAGQYVASGAVWLLVQVGRVMSASTSVGLGTNWFGTHEAVMATLAASVVLPMAFLGVIQALYHQNAAVLVRAFLVNLPLAMLLTGVAVELVRLSLSITDMFSAQVLAQGGVDTRHLLSPVANFLGAGGPPSAGVPEFVEFVGALVVSVSALALWLELVVRAAAVSAAALFLPISMAALVWPAVSHWCRRLAETLAALVLSKFVVAAVLSLSVGAIAGGLGTEGPNGGGFAAVISGIALLLIAALAPFTLLKLVPVAEAGALAHLESVRHRLTGAARAPMRAGNLAMDLLASGGAASVAGSAISSAGQGAGERIMSGTRQVSGRTGEMALRARSSPAEFDPRHFERANETPQRVAERRQSEQQARSEPRHGTSHGGLAGARAGDPDGH